MTPLTLVVAWAAFAFRDERAAAALPAVDDAPFSKPSLLPWFLWLFIAMVLLNSTGLLAPAVQQAMGQVSRVCLVAAIAALGMKTSFRQLARMGWQPVKLIVAETLWLAILVLAAVLWMR